MVDRYASGREQRVEVLRLPLRDPDGRANFIISCTVALEVSGYVDPEDRPYLLAQPVESAFFAV